MHRNGACAQMYIVEESQRRAWAGTLVDIVCYICIFQAAHAQELGQAPVHAERSSTGDNRMHKAMSALRSQIALIQQTALQWAYQELPRTLGEQVCVFVCARAGCRSARVYTCWGSKHV